MLSVFAHNIQIKIELEGATFKNILTKYKHKITPTSLEIEIKDIQSEEQKDILFDVELAVLSKEQPKQVIGKVQVIYKRAVDGKLEEYSTLIAVNRTKQTSKQMNDHVERQRCRLKVAINIEKAAELGHKGKFEEAKLLIEATVNDLRSSGCGSDVFVKE